jgi:hypothetical protein
MQQIAGWLEKLGMSEYAERFAENRIDLSVLPDLTDQHLKDLGIALGDRSWRKTYMRRRLPQKRAPRTGTLRRPQSNVGLASVPPLDCGHGVLWPAKG